MLRQIEQSAADDGEVMRRAYAVAAERDVPPSPMEAAELCREAALAVHPQLGLFLYQLVRSVRPALVVEFGTSFGASTIYIAAALRDNGSGQVIGSELHPAKAQRARANLERAGLDGFADVRTGDAHTELATVPGPIDILLLDGWKELYLPVLRVLEPALRDGALVVSDNLPMLPDDFLAYIRDTGHGYVSQDLSLGDGIELSLRVCPDQTI